MVEIPAAGWRSGGIPQGFVDNVYSFTHLYAYFGRDLTTNIKNMSNLTFKLLQTYARPVQTG